VVYSDAGTAFEPALVYSVQQNVSQPTVVNRADNRCLTAEHESAL
jgi:hypothetical protein